MKNLKKIVPTHSNHPAYNKPRGYYICKIGTSVQTKWSRVYQCYNANIRVRNTQTKTNDFYDYGVSVGKNRIITQEQFNLAIKYAKKNKKLEKR